MISSLILNSEAHPFTLAGGFFSKKNQKNKKMDTQRVTDVKVGLEKGLANSIGKDLEVVSPDEIFKTDEAIQVRNKYLNECSKKIMFLENDKLKDNKIFSILLEIKERYPSIRLADFLKFHIEKTNISQKYFNEIVKNASQAERYYKNPEKNKMNNFDNDLKNVEQFRGRMLDALRVIGINYKSSPSIEVLAKDFNNFILKSGNESASNFDWSSLGDKISNIGNRVGEISENIVGAMGATSQIINSFKKYPRPDINYIPPTYTPVQAQQSFVSKQLKKAEGINWMYIAAGAAVLVVLFVVLKK